MNRQFHNKKQSLTVTDKQAGVGRLFDWSKNLTGHMSNVILEEKYYKMSFKALPLKYSGQKNRQEGKGGD